jgi:hypothetical protein
MNSRRPGDTLVIVIKDVKQTGFSKDSYDYLSLPSLRGLLLLRWRLVGG